MYFRTFLMEKSESIRLEGSSNFNLNDEISISFDINKSSIFDRISNARDSHQYHREYRILQRIRMLEPLQLESKNLRLKMVHNMMS